MPRRTPAPGVLPLALPPVSLANPCSSFSPHLTHHFLQEGICENILQIGLGAPPRFPGPDLLSGPNCSQPCLPSHSWGVLPRGRARPPAGAQEADEKWGLAAATLGLQHLA